MASLVDKLTASGGSESAGFLNDILEQLWPNINVAAGQIAKDTVEPVLATTLPGPLSSLRFVKLDLGHVPIRFHNVDVHKTSHGGIKLDLDVDWAGVCDIELDGNHVPKIGIEKVQLQGRLSILLAPLTSVMPLIGAAQVAFINPPQLQLSFTDAASIADSFLVAKTIRNVILNVLSGMAVLPNRILVKLDGANDYFRTYQPHHGVVRVTVEKATGLATHRPPSRSTASKLLAKLTPKDVPDSYVKVRLGAEAEWRTSTQKDTTEPVWAETHDFLVTDFEQVLSLDVQDADVGEDDDLGLASRSLRQILLDGGGHGRGAGQELALSHSGEPTPARLTIRADFYDLVPDGSVLAALASEAPAYPGQVCGLVNILIASASGLGQRLRDAGIAPEKLRPSVRVTWGKGQTFQIAVRTYAPGGADILNPAFDQAFVVPLTAELLAGGSGPAASFRVALLDGDVEVGAAELPYAELLAAPGLSRQADFDVGAGASVRAAFSLRAVRLAE